MDKIGFLILNYCTFEETVNCIYKIEKLIDTNNYEIVVVDNNSPDKSGEKLLDYYNSEKIHILLNNANNGFTEGNNVGYEYLRNKLKCNYIVMLNSDVYILQKNFFQLIKNEFEKSNFAILGPLIHNKNNKFQMAEERLVSIKELRIRIIKLQIKLIFAYFNIDLKKNSKIKVDINNYFEKKENVILHGCCLIFSPIYIKNFEKIPSKTKFYCEEEIIYIESQKRNMKTIYAPNIEVFHLRNTAINNTTKNLREKRIFVLKNLIVSNKILLKELKQFYKNKE